MSWFKKRLWCRCFFLWTLSLFNNYNKLYSFRKFGFSLTRDGLVKWDKWDALKSRRNFLFRVNLFVSRLYFKSSLSTVVPNYEKFLVPRLISSHTKVQMIFFNLWLDQQSSWIVRRMFLGKYKKFLQSWFLRKSIRCLFSRKVGVRTLLGFS